MSTEHEQELERVKKELAEAKLPTVEHVQDIYSIYRERERAEKAEKERDCALLREDALARELIGHREKAQGNYWAWQGNNEDQLESLVTHCPVLIQAKDLQAILKERDEALAKLAESLHVLVQINSQLECDGSVIISNAIREKVKRIMACDCGKGWRSPEEYAALEARAVKADEFRENLSRKHREQTDLCNELKAALVATRSKLANSIPVEGLSRLDNSIEVLRAIVFNGAADESAMTSIKCMISKLESLRKAHQCKS